MKFHSIQTNNTEEERTAREALHKAARDLTIAIARATDDDELVTARIGACMVNLEERAIEFALTQLVFEV